MDVLEIIGLIFYGAIAAVVVAIFAKLFGMILYGILFL